MSALYDVIALILIREGGVKDVGDGKGTTYYGQTTDWLETFGLPVPKSAVEAGVNYRTWLQKTQLDQVLPQGEAVLDELADIVIDMAVMSDHRKAIKALQTVLNVSVDGAWGPATAKALQTANRRQLACDVIAWDMSYQGRLITSDPSRAQYAAGWANRMADHVRRLA